MPKDIDMTATSSVPSSSQAQPLEGEVLPAAKELTPLSSDYPADHLPANVRGRRSRRWRWIAVAVLLAAGAAGGGIYWKYFSAPPWPLGIVFSNGRVEAEEIDIDAKFAERVAQLLVDEGDVVSPGQIVARMDIRDVQASLNRAEAQVLEAQETLDEAKANVSDTTAQLKLAKQEFDRTNALVARGFATYELLDQRQQALVSTTAALAAANNRAGEASRALDAAKFEVDLYKVNIADNTLVSPTFGRIQYRISNVGEVLPAGGKVFTMLDFTNVYMDVYLPTADAGRARVGDEARIVLDAFPKFVIPAHVSFIATQAQFTPKAVETKDERDKLMFRVKVRIDKSFLAPRIAHIRTGLPGVAYVRVDNKTEWPASLRLTAAR
jgi:HlyD family secretion protein